VDAAAALEAATPREPITVILSEKGWIRAAKGAVADPSELKFKEGDRLAFLVPAETTDRLILFASDGRAFTLPCDKLPNARGQGEPIRLMLELDDATVIASVFPYAAGRKRVVASTGGYGFVVPEDELLSARKAGKAVLNADGGEALLCLEAAGDHLALLGENGKALIVSLAELPEMPRGKGVKLQSYREGGLKDALVFSEAEGPVWPESGGRKRAWPDWRDWTGKRASAGKLAPRGMKRLRA
jgi:topoisomerase-4 subunit A